MKMASGDFSIFRFFTNVDWFWSRIFLTEKNETETENFSVGFSVGFSVKPPKKTTV